MDSGVNDQRRRERFTRTETPPDELVEVPKEYKGLVFGKGGKNLMDISNNTGAKVIRRNGEVFIIEGTEEAREKARIEIKVKIAGARLRGPGNKFNKFGVYIDGLNLPENCKLKLEQVSQEDRVVIPESYTQYRLKPVKELMQQEISTPTDQPIYLSSLFSDALESLRRIKQEMTTKQNLKADMWCHFGKAVIRGPDQEEADRGSWSIDDATNKFKSSLGGNLWKTALKSGVKLDAKVLERHICDNTPDEYVNYAARYELAFVTPCGYQVILKVWVKKGDVGKKLEDIPAPFSDVKNILKEIEFKDETTRSRCKGWLILPSRKYLQADILFPGCAFDCRLHIRGRIDNALVADYAPKTEVIQTLARYVTDLTLTDEEGIGFCRLPEEKIPHGFHLTYKRCSKRSVYEISPGFTTILSKENSWRSDGLNKESRESTDLHLHCREWDNLLNNGDWSPEVIAATLPEFFRFVKKVQAIVLEGEVPPEILARGLAAVEAYNKALLSGKTVLKRIPLMLIGQDQAGKTSLKKSLRGIAFDPEEDSTDGIDVDPSFFNVCAETWRTGEQDEGQNSDKEISFDFQTARRIVDSLKMERKSTTVHTVTEKSSLFDSERANVEPETRNIKSSTVGENPQKSRNPAPTSSKNIPSVTPDPKESNPVGNLSALDVPDEVASVAETLLQSDREENEGEVYSTFWDFAGQSVYYVTHPLFLTKKAIYFLVYDLSLNPYGKAKPLVKSGLYKKTLESFSSLKTNLDYLEFWMKSVASLASYQEECVASELLPEKLPPVILVCTHADTPYNDRDPKELATEIFGFLKEKPYGCHLYDEPFFVDNTHLRNNKSECSQVQCLRKELVSVVKELPLTHDTIPIKWLKFEKVLQVAKKGGPKYITLEAAKDIAKACDINEDKEIKTLIDYLHDLRSLIHFDDNADLNKLVVLDPQWLVDVFKRVITVKPYDRKEKKVKSLWFKLEKEGILEETLLAHVWGPLFDNKDEETYQVLIEIMMKFSLLCPWSSGGKNKSYLVPSMLRSHPPEEVLELVKKAKVPPLFVKFLNGQVPPDLFPRLVVQFCQWVKDECKILEQPQLFHEFARFITSKDGDSVILICHSSVVEVIVLGDDDSDKLAKHLSASITLSTDVQVETTKLIYASDVHRQLVSILERMRNESRWQRDMSYKISFLCPVCSPEGAVSYCQNHSTIKCKEEECLHFLCESELRGAKKLKVCPKASFTPNLRVQVEMFEPWFAPSTEQGSGLPSSDGTTKEVRVRSIPENCARELNITLLASEWSSSMGGLSTLNRKLAVLLAKQPQVNVTVLVPQNACSEEDKKNASQSNVTIQEAKKRPGYDDPLDWLCSPPKSLSIDVIVGHGARLGKQAQFITESHSCKWVQMVHTAPEELGMYKEYLGAVAKGEMKNRVEVDLCKLADLVVALGAKLKEAYSSYLRYCQKTRELIQLIPGVFDEYKKVKQDSQEGKTFKVLTLGLGDPEDFELKGYDIAPKALAELRDSSYCLVFVGTPEGKQDEVKERLLESGIPKDQLIVREFIQSKEGLKELFCEVDLAIMPSRTEGFGLTGLEALSAGLPILVSGNSGFGHALRSLPQGHSFVVESKNPNDWAKAIASVRQKERAKRLQDIQSLRTSYEERYSWEEQCTSLIEKLWSSTKDVLQLDKLSIVSEPSLKYAHRGESVEGPEDNNSKDPGEVPIATAREVRDIRAATMMFEAKHKECIRVLPYIKDGQIVVQFYVYSGESGIPKDLEEEAQQFFKKMNVKLEWSDLYNNSVNVLKVQRLVYSSEKPKTLTASQVDEMNDVIEKSLPELSKHRNITSVQASFKIKNSTRTDEPCITLYVLGKGFFPIGERKFPNALGDYLVDVVNGFWTRAGSSKYWEPNSAQKPSKILCSGVSIGVQGKEAAGTLGAIVKNGSTFYALSNHHVMNSEQSKRIVHPALYDHLNYLRYYLAQYRREVKDVTDLETKDSVNDLTTREALVSNFEELKSRKDIYVQGYSSEGELFMELIEKAEEDFQQGKEPPREIGEWEVGVCGNFVWSDGKKYYIDAAIAKLFDKEVKNFEGKTARLIGNDGKPRGCSPVDKETIFNNPLCKSGRTTVYTEIENRIVGNKKNVETPHYMISSPCYDLRDLPFISYEMKEFACETCEEKQFIVTDSTEPLSCDKCVEKEATLRMKFWRYRVLCISEGEKRFAEDGDSGAVIFEIDQKKGDEKFLSGLGLFFAKGQTEHDRLYFASPLKIVLDALTDKLPKGGNLELVSKF